VCQKSNPDEPEFRPYQKQSVWDDRRILVQWMQSDTAPPRIIHRLCQQVVQVDQYRGQHRNPRSKEFPTKKNRGNRSRYHHVQADMQVIPKHRYDRRISPDEKSRPEDWAAY
jgi:hypothetical protein